MANTKQPPCRLKLKELQVGSCATSNARWSQLGGAPPDTFVLCGFSGHVKACQMELHAWWQGASQKSINQYIVFEVPTRWWEVILSFHCGKGRSNSKWTVWKILSRTNRMFLLGSLPHLLYKNLNIDYWFLISYGTTGSVNPSHIILRNHPQLDSLYVFPIFVDLSTPSPPATFLVADCV